MCGIAGMISRGAVQPALLKRMTAQLVHRGPDDHGVWTDDEAGVGFGHRRLAIVDLSPAGHQPMLSADGRWVITFNGEIYNHVRLREDLEAAGGGPEAGGRPWRGHSDTETLLECISEWGLERTIGKCVGMFAFALWDRQERRLHLVRDRFGEKPLYYGWAGGAFVFASELKAIRALPGFDRPINRRAVGLFARLGYIPAPHSIFEGIYKLEPGCILSAVARTLATRLTDPPVPGEGLVRRYWCYRDVVRAGLANPIRDEGEALDGLEQALLEAVRDQAVADVPVGAFLSGGIDSSTVVALYREHSPVRTFTIGFEEAAFDEAPYARAVAEHLGTDHNEGRVTAREAQEVIPLLPQIYDEPFADSSQIPTYLVSKHARGQVTVALTGDGGDELFGGYNRHVGTARLWDRFRRIPRPLRSAAAGTLALLPPAAWNIAADAMGRRSHSHDFGGKVRKAFGAMAAARDIDDLHDSFLDEWHGDSVAADGGRLQLGHLATLGSEAPDVVRMMHRDAVCYLPDDILCKVDRASMAVSLETRLPMLDHRVAAIAARIPHRMKVDGGVGKLVLRRLLFRHVPETLFDRPKAGFGIPVGDWIKGPLRSWAEDLLDPNSLEQGGGFDPAAVRRRWQDHLSGRRDGTAALWFVLMFQAWLNEHRSGATAQIGADAARDDRLIAGMGAS